LKISFEKTSVPIEGEFGNGWKQTITLPDTIYGRGERLVLSVEGGWLRARHESSDGQLNWQLILCRIRNHQLPVVRVMEGLPFVEVSYLDGRYFVRQSQDFVRALREPGASDGLFERAAILTPDAKAGGTGTSNVLESTCAYWEDQGWCYVTFGPQPEAWNAVVRLNPVEFADRGYGFNVSGAGHIHLFHGDRWVLDDGELLVANRTRPEIYIAEKKRQAAREAILSGRPLPELDVTSWLNTDEPLTWDSLRGKVVLVDFWGTWCGPCVAKLPETQALHDKYAGRGLMVLGIHSNQGGEECAAFVAEHSYTFPIAIDSGKTADAFAVDGWPTYFLIDREGKVVKAFEHEPPRDEAIEKLLDEPGNGRSNDQ
jgi:thiol-disulfide isomerase/thioredoxin